MKNFKKVTGLLIVGCMIGMSFVSCSKKSEVASGSAPATVSNTSGTVQVAADVKKPKMIIRFSTGASESSPNVQAAIKVFKPMVEEASNGQIEVEIYFGGVLGDDTKGTEACRSGELEMVNTSTAPLVGLVPELAIFDIPFLFNNEQIADGILDGNIGNLLSAKLAEKGLVVLAWNENGFRDLTNSVRVVSTPDDLKGLKIRTMENKYHLQAWKALGASPTPMSWSEVFTALQQGIIDGQENPIPNFYSARIQEVNKFVTCTGHVYSPLIFMYSKELFDSYDSQTQKILRDAATAYAKAEREMNRQQTIELKQALIAEGCTVTDLTPEQKQLFKDKTAVVWDSVEKSVGKDFIDNLKKELVLLER